MNDRPAVSIVMIFLNEEEFINEAIDSVLAQTTDEWELVLVDVLVLQGENMKTDVPHTDVTVFVSIAPRTGRP